MNDLTGGPDSATPTASAPAERGHTLYRALAWVGVVAGVVFIVGVVFAAGLALGGGHRGWDRGGPAGSTVGGCPMMKSGAAGGGMQRGGAPEEVPGGGPGMMAPQRVPPAPAPS